MSTRVTMSTETMAMKMYAWAMVASVWPTFSVPGIFSSGTRLRSLSTAVVGANEPIPNVSKKEVTKPSATSKRVGLTSGPAAAMRARRTAPASAKT
jgi:hypothetical protein